MTYARCSLLLAIAAGLGGAAVEILGQPLHLTRIEQWTIVATDLGAGVLLGAIIGLLVWRLTASRRPTGRALPAISGALPLLAVVAILVGLLHAPGGASPAPGRRAAPDVVWVSLDTFRGDHLGVLGGPAVTPNLDALARDSRVYTEAFAPAPLTGPSHAAMLLDRTPWEMRAMINGVRLPEELPSGAEQFTEHGYSTAAFVSCSVLAGQLGFDRGFGVYDQPGDDVERAPVLIQLLRRRDASFRRPGTETVDRARDWWRRTRGPRFLWVHLYDAHGPYRARPEIMRQFDLDELALPNPARVWNALRIPGAQEFSTEDVEVSRRAYAAAASEADMALGSLFETVGEDALLVVVGDHGESLGEHDYYFSHGFQVYREDVHVPLLVRWRKHVEPGMESAVMSIVGLVPAMADAAHADDTLELVSGEPVLSATRGVELRGGFPVRIVPGERPQRLTPEEAREVLPLPPGFPGGRVPTAVVLRDERFTVLVSDDVEVYDRAVDPGEETPLDAVPPELLPSVYRARGILDGLPRQGEERVDEEIQRQLEALGYIH